MKRQSYPSSRSLFIGITFLALYTLTGCGGKAAPAADTGTEQDDRIPVRTAAVKTELLGLPIHASGILNSASEQRLSFKIGGVIRKIYVDEGDQVKAGQLLAVLDKTEIDAQVSQAKQALDKAERDLARVKGLYRDSSATLELLQNATTGRDLASETVKIASFNQQYAEIRATQSGKIIKKIMNEGEITGPGMPVFVLFETGADDWVVQADVSDRDWARIQIGMPAKIRFDAYPETTFNGRVSDLAPAADPGNGLYRIEIRVRPEGKRFAPGLFASVDLNPPGARKYSVVPIEAIMEGDGQSAWVFALQPDGEHVSKLAVQLAFIDGANAVISSGLDSVKEVVTTGAAYLNESKTVIKR